LKEGRWKGKGKQREEYKKEERKRISLPGLKGWFTLEGEGKPFFMSPFSGVDSA